MPVWIKNKSRQKRLTRKQEFLKPQLFPRAGKYSEIREKEKGGIKTAAGGDKFPKFPKHSAVPGKFSRRVFPAGKTMFRHQSLSSNKYAPSNFRKEFASRLSRCPGSRQCHRTDSWISDIAGEREWPLARTIRSRSTRLGERESTEQSRETQEGSKRRNSRVSVVSGTITGTYPLRYPRPYVSSSLLLIPLVNS